MICFDCPGYAKVGVAHDGHMHLPIPIGVLPRFNDSCTIVPAIQCLSELTITDGVHVTDRSVLDPSNENGVCHMLPRAIADN